MSPNGSSDTEPFFSEDHAGEETGGDVCVEEKKKKKMVKCRLCGENVPDDVELQQLHEKWYHYQEVIDVSGENLGRGSEYLIIFISCQMERTLVKNSMVGLRMD